MQMVFEYEKTIILEEFSVCNENYQTSIMILKHFVIATEIVNNWHVLNI